jgi:RNA polymerase sigma-70 factor (ECF subfamily)
MGEAMIETTAPGQGPEGKAFSAPRGPGAIGEAELLARIRARDESAYEILVRRHADRMFGVARRFLSCDADCADAVQDAFLSAVRSIDSFAGHAQLGTWLHRIVVNACLHKLRSQARRRTVPLDDLLPTFDEDGRHSEPVACWSDPTSCQARTETQEQVRACIDRLPDAFRTVLWLRDLEGLDTAETAKVLGTSYAVVKTRLHRARQALRALLEPVYGQGVG